MSKKSFFFIMAAFLPLLLCAARPSAAASPEPTDKTITREIKIGKKTAERLVLELRGKLGGLSGSLPQVGKAQPAAAPSPRQDILHALLALGYNEREAAGALKLVPEEAGVNDGIKLALKALAKV